MRRLSFVSLVPLVLLAIACEARPHIGQSDPMPGTPLQFGDSLLFFGKTIGNVTHGWQSPGRPTMATDVLAQRAIDAEGDKRLPRLQWAVLDKASDDRLDIEVMEGDTIYSTEQWMRTHAAAQHDTFVKARRVIEEDTVEWGGGGGRAVHEWRLRAYDAKAKAQWLARCVSSTNTRPKPTVVCYTAHGPTAFETMAKSVAGLMLSAYRGGAVAARQQGRPAPPASPAASQPAPDPLGPVAVPGFQTMTTQADGWLTNPSIGFRVRFPATFARDSVLEDRANRIARLAGVLAVMATSSVAHDTITMSATPNAPWESDSASWRARYEHAMNAPQMAGVEGTHRANIWRADTAMYAYEYRTPDQRYHRARCVGSWVGRVQPAVVCVYTSSSDPSAYADVASSLVLITPGAEVEARVPNVPNREN